MPRGPLPKPADQRRRRNAPTIPTTNLPRGGRTEPAPECPYSLGDPGERWWVWAWQTPQACAWDEVGHLYVVARRAQLEDLLAKVAPDKALGLHREMREIDDRLGLTPKGLAQLRWQIVADPEPESTEDDEEHLGDRFAGLRAVG